MATPTYAQLIAAYPELTTSDSDEQTRIGTILAQTETVVGDELCTTAARILAMRLALAAHWWTLNKGNCSSTTGGTRRGASGPVTGRQAGGRSVTYGSVSLSGRDAMYATTDYGQRYLALRGAVFVGGVVG